MIPRKRLPANDHIEKPKEEVTSCLICGKILQSQKEMRSHICSQPDRQRETMDDHQEPSSSDGGMKGLIAMAKLAKKKRSGNKTHSSSTAINSGHNKQEDQLEYKNDAHSVILITSTPHHNEDSHEGKDQELLTTKCKTLDELKTDDSHQDFTCLMSKKQRIDERSIANNKVVKFEHTTYNKSSTQQTLGGQRSGRHKNYSNFNRTGGKKFFPTPQAMGGHRSSQYQGKIKDGQEKSALANDKAVEEENQSAGIVIGLTGQVGSNQSKVCNKLLPRGHALGGHQRCQSDAPSVIEAPTTFGAISSTHSKKQGHHQLEHKSDARNLITSTFLYEKHLPPKKCKLLYEHQRCQSDAPSVIEAPTTFGAISSTHSKKQDHHQLEHKSDARNLMSTFLYEKHLPPKKRKLRYELKQGSSYQDFPSLTSKEQRICERTEAQNKNGKSAAEETINAKSRVAFDDKKRVNMVTSGAGCEYLDNGMEVEDKSTRSPISKSNNKKIMAPMKMASTKKEMAEGGTSGIDYKQNSWMTSYNDKEISALANDDALQAENRNAGSFTNLTRTVGRHSWNKLFHKSVTWGHKRSRSGAPRGIIKHPTATTSLLTAAQENIQSKTGSRKFDFALNDNKVQELEEALVHQPSSRKVLDFDLNELRVMEEEADQPDKFSGGV